jgi:hypothetical protein
MWLLDANMDVHLVSVLNDFGVACDAAGNRGWTSLKNGDLVMAAVADAFVCLLTRDQLFGESASRALKAFRSSQSLLSMSLNNLGISIGNGSSPCGCRNRSRPFPVG